MYHIQCINVVIVYYISSFRSGIKERGCRLSESRLGNSPLQKINIMKCYLAILLCISLVPSEFILASEEENYYQLLGVEESASTAEIRKAFKKLAVKLHPDKNPTDKSAHSKFVLISEAYEVLKDAEQREEYDANGKSRVPKHHNAQYHSYSYYRDQFGLYDDDELIVTLTKDDYDDSVLEGIWFVNFYSTACGHCHRLAPAWRSLSRAMDGVVQIAAVNCEDDVNLCWRLGVKAYPTLLFYDKKAGVKQSEEYHGDRSAVEMENFLMRKVSRGINIPSFINTDQASGPWLLVCCCPKSPCLDEDTQIKLSIILSNLAKVGVMKDELLCKQLDPAEDTTAIFWRRHNNLTHVQELTEDSYIFLANRLIQLLPPVEDITVEKFKEIRNALRSYQQKTWLLCLFPSLDNSHHLMMKKLSARLQNFNFGTVECSRWAGLCGALHAGERMACGVLKGGGAWELLLGAVPLERAHHALAAFTRRASAAANFNTLSPQDVNRIFLKNAPWVIGWVLPECPPCKRILPALRSASELFRSENIQFGVVDCSVHSELCQQHGLRSYPRVLYYNASRTATYQGQADQHSIAEFVEDQQTQLVESITLPTFPKVVSQKPSQEIRLVAWFAPWCGPCQRLHPEWRKLAKKLSHVSNLRMGSVDCVAESSLCGQEDIRSYPTVRLYPAGSLGARVVLPYKGNRDMNSMYSWMQGILNQPANIDVQDFNETVNDERLDRAWLIIFESNTCDSCKALKILLMKIKKELANRIEVGSLNCDHSQRHRRLCEREVARDTPQLILYRAKEKRVLLQRRVFRHLLPEIQAALDGATSNDIHDEL